MYIHGYYYNRKEEKISVYILVRGDRSKEVEIGGDGNGITFSDDPVEITSQVNDTFDHILCLQASIRLLCENYVREFFSGSCRDAVVNIYRGTECLFAGYIEPQTFSQGYNECEDEVELTCVDALSALQYSKYKNVGSPLVLYNKVKAEAQQLTFHDIVMDILNGVMDGIDILGGHDKPLYYDGSKYVAAEKDKQYSVLQDISISELLFLGDEEDDVWTQEDVLTEILRYLNLHIRQAGMNLYLFSWETIRSGKSHSWHNLNGNGDLTIVPRTVDITTSIVADCDTQISVAETYNQLKLTADVKEMQNIVKSPLDSDALRNAFLGMQKYMTEYASDGEGKRAYHGFAELVANGSTGYDGGSVVDWYVQVRKCQDWRFYGAKKKDLVKDLCQGVNQQDAVNYLGTVPGASMLVSVGSVKKTNGGQDNSLVSKISMTDYLVISVNGNGKDEESEFYPNDSDLLKAIPCAEYVGNEVGGVFSPSDENTTNYIVISGKMVMNPLMRMTANYHDLRNKTWLSLPFGGQDGIYVWHQTVPSRNNGDGRYYTRRYWKTENWRNEVVSDDAMDKKNDGGFMPFTGEGPQEFEFKYSAFGDSTDKLSKVGVIQCMLIIGDKCVVEKRPGQLLGSDKVAGTGNGQLSDYVWMKYKAREECSSDDEYYQQSFSVGFDPKIGDKIIGTEFSIQNNLSYTDNVDADGTAIPVRMSDKVHGAVKFIILGPVNSVWEEIIRRHPTAFRHTKWSSNTKPILSHVSDILLEEFEVKVVSDHGKVGSDGAENDLVYLSDTKEDFVNTKDDLEMKITTALTSEECKALGIKNGISLSAPLNVNTELSLLGVYNTSNGELAKPEQHYVNDYWQEWHEPRVVMEQNLMDEHGNVSPFDLYRHPAIGKTFHVQGISYNLTSGTAQMTIKEIF